MAHLQTCNALGDLWNISNEMDRFLWSFGRNRRHDVAPSQWAPAVDISEDAETLTIRADLAGLRKEDVKINVEDGVLTLHGERKFDEQKENGKNYYRIERGYGVFARSFTLPNTVNSERISAHMKDGVLEITIPKREEAKPKQIEIQVH